ncbi:MAG: hypothetical protein AB7G44_15140 [Bacteroidia bacterium]
MKKRLLTLIFITALTFAQQAQAQETKEYATLHIIAASIQWKDYVIAYPDGKIEKGELSTINIKNMESNANTLNGVFNMMAKKGYKLVSSTGGGDTGGLYLFYIFEK